MSLLDAQSYVEGLRDLVERVEYRRPGSPRAEPRTRSIDTPESIYAERVLRCIVEGAGAVPPPSPLVPEYRRRLIAERVRRRLLR